MLDEETFSYLSRSPTNYYLAVWRCCCCFFLFLRNVERYPFRAKFGTKLSRNVRHNNFVLFSFSCCFAFPSTPAQSNRRLSGRRSSSFVVGRNVNASRHVKLYFTPFATSSTEVSVTQIEQLKLICFVDIELGPRNDEDDDNAWWDRSRSRLA